MTELKQFLSGPAAFSDIRDTSMIAVFKDYGGRLKLKVTPVQQFWRNFQMKFISVQRMLTNIQVYISI